MSRNDSMTVDVDSDSAKSGPGTYYTPTRRPPGRAVVVSSLRVTAEQLRLGQRWSGEQWRIEVAKASGVESGDQRSSLL